MNIIIFGLLIVVVAVVAFKIFTPKTSTSTSTSTASNVGSSSVNDTSGGTSNSNTDLA